MINSFSKYFSMTGWRLGWMVVPEDLLRPVECLAQNLFISPPTLSQLRGGGLRMRRANWTPTSRVYARNRALLLDELPKAGFDRLAPADGAFYIYADVRTLTNDSRGLLPAHAGRDGRRGDAGRRLRSGRGSTASCGFPSPGDREAEIMTAAAHALKRWLS